MRKQLTAAAIATCLALVAVGALAGTVDVDYRNATFRIDNEDVKLSNVERAVHAAPGSATQHVTRVFGKPVDGRLDSKPAAAIFLADEPGGSGIFSYVALALSDCSKTNAVLLGDRIMPRSIVFHGRSIVVTYLDRKPDEPMAATPKVKKSVTLGFGSKTCQLAK
ncbi:hypothetical protein SAMN04487926_16715 [Paraburkholderia steynii]|uniref:Uncharacterized protein n=1 Tax=Paraburkholderia steynii TaxID=1245441 RepID=A0A7Z7FPS5_9BURK|nr:hypothetical protein [Paraburkholderia steynii]SDJ58011.1 hypothetical protein SAMN04487926_16715 [Paraburkholderia steynii]